MANYEFQCLECNSAFHLDNLEPEEAREVFCVECKSEKIEIVGFDATDLSILLRLVQQMSNLNERFDAFITGLEEESKAEGETEDEGDVKIVH